MTEMEGITSTALLTGQISQEHPERSNDAAADEGRNRKFISVLGGKTPDVCRRNSKNTKNKHWSWSYLNPKELTLKLS